MNTTEISKVTVLGGGTWGTTAGFLLAGRAGAVSIWCYEPEVAESLNLARENRKYLPGIVAPNNVRAETGMAAALAGAGLVVFATPSGAAGPVLEAARPHVPAGIPVLNLSKGFDEAAGRPVSRLVAERLDAVDRIAVLSGPNLAREIALGLPTSTVLATADKGLGRRLLGLLMTPTFRVYLSDDPAGVELGGALKNIFALGAGICDGLGYGDNTKAAYLTRALVEMIRAGEALGARRDTFYGLSGFGDLVATAISRHSRNRSLGERIGRGMGLAEAEAATTGIAEGVGTTRILHRIGTERGLDLPITTEIHRILFEHGDPRAAVGALMGRSPKDEGER